MSRKRPLEPVSPELSFMQGLSKASPATAEQYSRILNEGIDALDSSSGGFKAFFGGGLLAGGVWKHVSS